LKDVVQENSTYSSGLDITILQSEINSQDNFSQENPTKQQPRLVFDEYGNRVSISNLKRMEKKMRNKSFHRSNSSLKSRISNRIISSKKRLTSTYKTKGDDNTTKIKNITSNVVPSNVIETNEFIQKSNINNVVSGSTQHIDLNFQSKPKKFQTSIESSDKAKKIKKAKLFEESKSMKTNIKLTESNIQLTTSQNKTKNKPSEKIQIESRSFITDTNFIKALKNMKDSITQIKKKGVNELKTKNDISWVQRQDTDELAAIKAGLGGDVSRVNMISNFSVISDFDKSGDTLLNLEKYLGGLSTGRGNVNEEIQLTDEELPKLKFLLEKLRVLLGKSNFFNFLT
jgi:hypothetical protein